MNDPFCPGEPGPTIEVWTHKGLVTLYLLFVMKPASRKVHFAGCTVSPDEAWVKQIARNLTDSEDGFLNGSRYILMDRDTKFSAAFRRILSDAEVKPVLLPPHSPNLNANLERFHRSVKEECLDRMIFFGEDSVRKAVKSYVQHFHEERNHQGLENKITEPGPEVGTATGEIKCNERLGGLLNYYYCEAA